MVEEILFGLQEPQGEVSLKTYSETELSTIKANFKSITQAQHLSSVSVILMTLTKASRAAKFGFKLPKYWKNYDLLE